MAKKPSPAKKRPTKATIARKRASVKPRVQRTKVQPWQKTYKEEFAMVGYELALLGFGQSRIAKVLCVPESHVEHWKKNIENFRAAVASGSEIADAKVAMALYHRAIGYTHTETKVHFNKLGEASSVDVEKHYPPDTGAAQYWLRLRQKELWKDESQDGQDEDLASALNNLADKLPS